jgi:ABC-type transport system involved in multi-copper enzyme maturation permease subunit
MIWVTWRQFRAQAITGLAVLAAAAAYFVITGLSMHHAYALDTASCGSLSQTCDGALSAFRDSYSGAFDLAQLLMLVALGLLGVFWGAPLIARELETGTHQVAWNQSITRTRWLAVKLACVGAATIGSAALLSYLLTWWSRPLNPIGGSRFEANQFATHDIVPVGYAVFSLALGVTAGVLIRRTVPAMAVTLAVFVGVQILMPTLVRPHLLPSTTVSYSLDAATANLAQGVYTQDGGAGIYLDLPFPRGAWLLDTTPIEDSADRAVAASDHLACFPSAGQGKSPGFDVNQIVGCLAPYHLHESMTYQPADHYWPLQWLETGIFTALAAAMSGFCFWWLRRRN